MTEEQFREIRDLLRDIYVELVHLRSPDAVVSWDDEEDKSD